MHLQAGSNRLQSLPAQLCQLTNLERLSVHINFLKWLPEKLGQCTKLTHLSVRQCAVCPRVCT
jgi:Leucine-rich repeat (LRR) protein